MCALKKQPARKLADNEGSGAFLFEAAWEVCNQVGGIYTVIRSKIPSVVNTWGKDQYCLLGPYFPKEVGAAFEPIEDLTCPVGKAVQRMRDMGFEVHYGLWLVTGRPRVVLFNPMHIMHRIDEIKFLYWENHHISIPSGDKLLDMVLCLGFQVKEFIKIFCSPDIKEHKHIIAHFHEWMAGTPIPDLRKEMVPVKTVFTTHATLLGRYLAMNDPEFYSHLPHYNWEAEAKHFNIEATVKIERAAAHGSHIFTTVSDVTALECKYLLGRLPEKILPNGLNISRFEAVHEFQVLHVKYKEQIHEFVTGHFFPSYTFDLNKTIYLFTSGRFEYHNKGYNLTLEALARLNWLLKQANTDINVVAFFVTRQPYTSMNADVLNSRFLMEEVRRSCDEILSQISQRMFFSIASDKQSKLPQLNNLVDEHLDLKLRRAIQAWKSDSLPPVVTHNMVDDAHDDILNFIRMAGLINRPDDKVKIIYHPDFITQTNPLFRLDYGQFVRGCHIGVFPSYYEPWGYTPLECIASGIPAITSDLAGFGDFVLKNVENYQEKGIFVINRRNKSYNESADELAQTLFNFASLTLRERVTLRYKTEAVSVTFDWNELIRYYEDAYKKVLNTM